VDAFNRADVETLAEFYSDAINHQVAEASVVGRGKPQDVCGWIRHREHGLHLENIFEDGEWAILKWRDPLGLRGCSFFHIVRDMTLSPCAFQSRAKAWIKASASLRLEPFASPSRLPLRAF
jgi:hypothetical protein